MTDAVDQAFAGYGMALRREDEPPIPGEPLMSMADAKRITRELLARSVRPASGEVEGLVADANVRIKYLIANYPAEEGSDTLEDINLFRCLATALDRLNREGR